MRLLVNPGDLSNGSPDRDRTWGICTADPGPPFCQPLLYSFSATPPPHLPSSSLHTTTAFQNVFCRTTRRSFKPAPEDRGEATRDFHRHGDEWAWPTDARQ